MDPLDSDDDEELEALAVQLREGVDEESEVGDRTEAPAKRRPGALVFCVCVWGGAKDMWHDHGESEREGEREEARA